MKICVIGLGSQIDTDDLKTKVERAKNNPTELVNLLCKDFNVRQNEQDKWLNFDIASNEETYERF